MVPALIESIKELGLVLIADLSELPNGRYQQQRPFSSLPDAVDGVFKSDGILEFRGSIGMS